MSDELGQMRARADQLLHAGRYDEAIALHRAILERDPGDGDTAFNLAWMLGRTNEWDAAARLYASLSGKKGTLGSDAALGHAAALINLRRENEAEIVLLDLLEKEPGRVDVLLNLGRIAEDRGHRQQASRYYRNAHEAAASEALPLARLIGTLKLGEEKQAATSAAEKLLASGNLSLLDRCDLGFSMAAAFDEAGEYERAWTLLQAANAAASTLEKTAGKPFDQRVLSSFVDTSIATFQDPPGHRPAGAAPFTPVFVCGLYRSGSSLLEQILGRHSRIAGGGEVEILSGMAARLPGYPACVPELLDSERASLREEYLDKINPLVEDAQYIIDKSPENFLHLGLIRVLFPEARIIHTKRNRMDNLLSIHFQHLAGRDYSNSPRSLSQWYDEYARLMDFWRESFGEGLYDSTYEDLVTETQESVTAILRYLGLDFEPQCLEPEASDSLVRTASVWQVREKIHTRSKGRAANYPWFVNELEKSR